MRAELAPWEKEKHDPEILAWRRQLKRLDADHVATVARLERIVGDLPSVEDLRDDEVEAMGTVVSEILER